MEVTVNGRTVQHAVAADRLLRDFVRDDLGLTGTKAACEDGMCGACALHLDGDVVKSCLVLAVEADGRVVTTVEGMGGTAGLHPVQQALIDNFGFQCGFCTPGLVMTIAALVRDCPEIDEEEARKALVGNICRCTGYDSIVRSCVAAARSMQAHD